MGSCPFCGGIVRQSIDEKRGEQYLECTRCQRDPREVNEAEEIATTCAWCHVQLITGDECIQDDESKKVFCDMECFALWLHERSPESNPSDYAVVYIIG